VCNCFVNKISINIKEEMITAINAKVIDIGATIL